MPLIQRLTLTFCSVFLLLLWLALGQDSCEQAIENLFAFAREQTKKMKINPFFYIENMECYVTPDEPLIDLLHSVHKDEITLADGRRKESEAIILSIVKIGRPEADYRSVIFTVKHPKEKKTGTAKIVCKGPVCHALVDKLQQYMNKNELSCVVKGNRDKYFMSTSPNDGIEIAIPYTIMQPENILTNFIKSQGTTSESWKANFIKIVGDYIVFWDSTKVKGGVIYVQLPLPASQVYRDQLEAAVELFNIRNKGLRDAQREKMTFTELPRTGTVERSKGPTGLVADEP